MNRYIHIQLALLLHLLCALVFLPAAALAEPAPRAVAEEQHADPLEPINRKIYQFNNVVDRFLLKPVTEVYRAVIPAWGRERVYCFLRNLATPVTFFNSLLQGDATHAGTSFWRFTLNSTFGLGGLFDFAGTYGLPDRVEDFGQTLGVYDVPSGPYLVLPFLGPSSFRDAGGRVVDVFLDPFNYVESDELVIARQALDIVETRSQNWTLLNEIKRTSLDEYATLRSLYLQNRVDLIHNGTLTPELEYDE